MSSLPGLLPVCVAVCNLPNSLFNSWMFTFNCWSINSPLWYYLFSTESKFIILSQHLLNSWSVHNKLWEKCLYSPTWYTGSCKERILGMRIWKGKWGKMESNSLKQWSNFTLSSAKRTKLTHANVKWFFFWHFIRHSWLKMYCATCGWMLALGKMFPVTLKGVSGNVRRGKVW